MEQGWLAAFERERAAGFQNLSRTHLDVMVPVTQRLVDLLIERAAAARHLGGLTVTLRGGDAIGVTLVKPVLGFAARLALDLRLRVPDDLASDPRIYLVIERPSLAWSAISRIAVAAGLAPAGVEIGRDGIAVDLGAAAARAGILDLLPALRAIAFEGAPEVGVLRLRLTVEIPEGGLGDHWQARSGLARGSSTRDAWLEPGDVLRELRGARIRGQLVATEGLVNDALGMALDAARGGARRGGVAGAATAPGTSDAGGASMDAQALARWIQGASVRFEHGRIVLEPDLLVG